MKKHADDRTLDLFVVPAAPAPIGGSLYCAIEVRHLLSNMLEKAAAADMSRYQIAARMSELVGHEITKTQLDSWTAESKTDWRFPFEYGPAFEAACNSTALQELFGRKRGTSILVGEEALLAELGRLDTEEQKLKTRKRALQSYLRKKR